MRTVDDLRRALAAETDDLAYELPSTLVIGRARSLRLRRRAAVATTVVVVASLVAGAFLLSGPAADPAAPEPSAVPWAPLPTGGAPDPRASMPASADPAVAALPPCRAGQLDVRAKRGSHLGDRLVTVTLGGTGAACRLQGYPDVRPVGFTAGVVPDPYAEPYDFPVAIGGDRRAVLVLAWRTDCALAVDDTRLRITLPGGGAVDVPGFERSDCPGWASPGPPLPIRVGGFRPAELAPAQADTPFAGVTVQLADVAIAGDAVLFTVVLTAPADRDVPLEPCPDYDVSVNNNGYISALNCAAVPGGVLPAGVPVAFAMQAPAPADRAGFRLTWSLSVPDPVSASTIVRR